MTRILTQAVPLRRTRQGAPETDLTNLHELSAADGARLIREGVISSEQLVGACLQRAREIDDRVQAWAFLDPAHALLPGSARDA